VRWSRLTFLTEIDLRNCGLHCIPFEFAKLNAGTLKTLRLAGNPLVASHKAIADSPIPSLISECQRTLDGADVSCLDVKLNLIGEPGVGKSTLLRRIRGATSASDEMSQNSKGKSLATEILDSTDFTLEGVRFVCYDFGGQHLYRYAHSLFLSNHSICLLCIDLTEIDSVLQGHLVSWMEAVVQRASKVVCVIVGTKSRSCASLATLMERMARFEVMLKSYYPNHLSGYIVVDSLVDDGIQKLKTILVHIAKKKVG
jgi:hypothetical protein